MKRTRLKLTSKLIQILESKKYKYKKIISILDFPYKIYIYWIMGMGENKYRYIKWKNLEEFTIKLVIVTNTKDIPLNILRTIVKSLYEKELSDKTESNRSNT